MHSAIHTLIPMFRRARILSAVTVLSLLAPSLALARTPAEIVDTTMESVGRNTFLSWSIESLGITKEDASCTLPYTRFPKAYKATLCTAQAKGVLSIFGTGKQYTLTQPITRGDAILMLTALTDRKESADISAFTDVKTDAEKQAVMNAIALKWMVPSRANLFGMRQPLTGTEAMSLLKSAANDSGASTTRSITIEIGNGTDRAMSLPKEDLMRAVWEILSRDYLHNEKIDSDEAAYKAIQGMVDSLGDPYTNFFPPVKASNFQDQIKGELSGIGAQVEDISGFITVVSPIPGTPADKAGIRSGDQILSADGVTLTGLGVDKAVTYIRGTRGTFVDLVISRGGTQINLRVQRDSISIPEITVSWQGNIAVVQLVQFGDTTLKQIRSVFTDINKKNPTGIVLDLRNNGGGLLTAADKVVSNFVPKNSVVAKVQTKTNTSLEITDSEPTVDAGVKVVVLVNKGSASASEIVAGALQDHNRAKVVGVQTFGKGTVQEVLSFQSGEALKVTIAEWVTPLGRKLDGVGVTPDVKLDTDDRDAQLKRALDILR